MTHNEGWNERFSIQQALEHLDEALDKITHLLADILAELQKGKPKP